jgi:hypothetical protein
MKTKAWRRSAAALACLATAALCGCGKPFTSASFINDQRFLAIIADPLEASPGDPFTFSAVITNKDGSLYAGPVAWAVVTGDTLREQGQANIDPNDEYLQMPGQPGFAWLAPAAADLPAKFGSPEKNGYLVTVAAMAFENGDLNGASFAAFKLFIISDKPAAERDINPTIKYVDVFANGKQITPGTKGSYFAPRGTAVLEAQPEQNLGALTYHWFATYEDFAPSLGATQKLAPDADGGYAVYLVLRQSYFFEHDDSTKTRITGEDWRRTEVVFYGS